MTDEMKALLTTMQHREAVADLLHNLADYFRARAREHDRSKLSLDEFGGFVRINHAARDNDYGSEEYMEALASEKGPEGCITLHYSRNPHHPEYHVSPSDMGLLDLIEMVIDWKGASIVYGRATMREGLKVHRERFAFADWQWQVIEEMVSILEGGDVTATNAASP